MTWRRGLLVGAGVTVAVALALTTGEPPDCAPCPWPVYANVDTADLGVGDRIGVCLEENGCRTVTVDGHAVETGSLSVPFDTATAAEADGLEVSAARAGDATWSARAHLVLRDDGGECGCRIAHARLTPVA